MSGGVSREESLGSPASESVTREAASGFVILDGIETRETIRAWCGAPPAPGPPDLCLGAASIVKLATIHS